MSDVSPKLLEKFVNIGLRDPFIRAIAGVVVVALIASYVLSTLGGGLRAPLAVGLTLMFGVILVVLRVLLRNVDSGFVRWLCLAASAIIVGTFLALIILLVPAVTICWPQAYHDELGLPGCASGVPARPFTAIAYEGLGISMDPANSKYWIRVNYRPTRQIDAERIVGALRQAGYQSDAIATDLNEVLTDDRSPGLSLIKSTTAARPAVDDVSRILKLAIPLNVEKIKAFPSDTQLVHGNIQIDLF